MADETPTTVEEVLPEGTATGTGFDTPTKLSEALTSRLATQADIIPAVPPKLPTGTEQQTISRGLKEEELFADIPDVAQLPIPVEKPSITGLETATPPREAAATYQSFVEEGTPEFVAAQGQVSAESLVGDIQGAVSAESLATPATEELNEKATVQFQLEQLFSSFVEGQPPPAWAAPAVRRAGAIMAQRGLGASSMAAAAITQSIMESGIPIAAQDANKHAAIQVQNLNNKQQSTLQNAMTYAAMDKANLDSRMTAAVNNAKSFLQLDTQNLTNQQQLKTIDLQSRFQKLFTDQAQENASRQFNAKSKLQTDQFFTELEVQVENANISRVAAMEQFNADQENAAQRYFGKLNDARDKFNINNDAVIQQSNATWRRDINTVNNVRDNENARINATNLLGINQSQLAKLWQRYRDEASWMIEISESAAQRAQNVAILSQQQDFNAEQFETDTRNAFFNNLGSAVINGVFAFLGA